MEKIDVINNGYIALVESWGSDERIIESARMSTHKGFQGWSPIQCDECGGMGFTTHDIIVGGTEHDTEERDCVKCKGRGTLTGDENMRASANLRNWLAFLTLRMDPAAQWEIRQYANALGTLLEERFPHTWELFKTCKWELVKR